MINQNWLVHRDYSIHTEGMPIQLTIFQDRLEVKAQYIKNKGFDDETYRKWIINYLKTYKKAKKTGFY